MLKQLNQLEMTMRCHQILEDDYIANDMAIKALEEIQQYRALGTVEELQQAINFKKYFMELYNEGLEVANWHENRDLEPLVNFIDAACNE